MSKLLKNVKITRGDFSSCSEFIDRNTFVYLDPPYRIITNASFNSYTEIDFNDNEQIKLKQFVDDINQKGAKVLVSNSDPKNSDDEDHFFDNLYKNYNIQRIEAKRMINCNGKSRGTVSELLISN